MVDKKEKNTQRPGHTRMQWMFALIANSTLMLYGLEAGWMSPTTRVLQSDQSPVGAPLSDNTISLVASILCMSATICVPFYSYIADQYGRKPAVIIVAIFESVSWIIKLGSPTTVGLVMARVIAGIGSGGSFIVVPLYVKEISQDDIRGTLGSLLTMAQNLGILVMYIMGACLDYYTVLWIVFSLPLVTVVLMIKAPESPAFLVKKGKMEEAAKTIAFLRGQDVNSEIVQREMDIMKKEELYFQSLPKISLISIFQNRNWRRITILTLLIFTVHASNGAGAIINYGSTALASSGIQYSSPDLQSLSIPILLIIGSFLSMSCVERFGRKLLLVGCLLLSVISMVILGCAIMLQSNEVSVPTWLPVLAMVVPVFAYGAGVSPLPYIIISEMFNFQIRAKVMGLVIMYSWFMTFMQLLLFAPISNSFGQHTTFFYYAAINLFGFLITVIFLPETKGKSVEEIEEEFRKK